MPAAPKAESAPKITQSTFVGGEAIDYKNGIAGAMFSAEAMDFRQKASQMSVLPGAREITHALSDLPTAMLQAPNGVRYMLGDAGHVYQVATDETITDLGTLNSPGAAGMVYNQQSDQIYMASQQHVSLYGQILAGSPGFKKDQFGPSASVANGTVNLYDSTTGAYDIPRNNAASIPGALTPSNYAAQVTNAATAQKYTVPAAVLETAANFCPFIPDIEPFYSIPVWITDVGTGDVTLTLHDSLNNALATVTIAHASVVVGWNNFIFSGSGVRAIPNAFATGAAAGYHFHVTSTVAGDTKIATVNASDLTGANFLLFAHRLVATNNGWHPMVIFGQYLCIGNGPYLSTYNFANDGSPNNGQWVRHQVSLDFGYEVCGLSVNNNMLVIAAEKRSTNASRSFQDGFLYFWDGVNVNFNSKIEVPMGAPYALSSKDNITYFIAAGSLYAYGGGQQLIKVRYIGYQNTDYLGTPDSTIVNPNMMDTRFNLLMIGYPSSTTNTNLKYGIYSWGAVELTYPNSFGYSYALSNGAYKVTGGNNLRIGMIRNFVDTLYTSWKYTDGSGTKYGIDIVDNSSKPAPNFNAWNLIWDGGVRWKMKRGLRIKINFLPLPANTTITVGYILDRSATPDDFNRNLAGQPSASKVTANAGDTSVVIEIDANFYEIQWGIVGTATGAATSPPAITGWACEVDTLPQAQDLRPDEITTGASMEAY
jgi:hypothetical protein